MYGALQTEGTARVGESGDSRGDSVTGDEVRVEPGPDDEGLSQGVPKAIPRFRDPQEDGWAPSILVTHGCDLLQLKDPKQGQERQKVRGVKSGKPAAASRVPSQWSHKEHPVFRQLHVVTTWVNS